MGRPAKAGRMLAAPFEPPAAFDVPARPPAAPALGIPALDAFAPFAPGRLALVVAPRPLREEIETRLLLDAAAHGAPALVACGDNRLDAYALLRRARMRGLEAALADGARVARAFTPHQMLDLLEDALPRLAQEAPPRVALVTGLAAPFLDEEADPDEARVLLRRAVRGLAAWSARTGLAVAATMEPPLGPRARELAALARQEAPFLLEAASHRRGWRVHLRPGPDVLLPARWNARLSRLDPPEGAWP